jgi:hypothetical protein
MLSSPKATNRKEGLKGKEQALQFFLFLPSFFFVTQQGEALPDYIFWTTFM